MLKIIKRKKPLPLFKNRTKSHSENNPKQRNRLYILTSCAYLISEPLTAKNVKASAITEWESLSCRQSNMKGISATAEKNTGKNLSQNKLSPPIAIQIFSKT
jgi:hypothetical protein